jgi:hypothetical protein
VTTGIVFDGGQAFGKLNRFRGKPDVFDPGQGKIPDLLSGGAPGNANNSFINRRQIYFIIAIK